MQVTNTEKETLQEWKLGDIIRLGDTVVIYAMVVQSKQEVMLVSLETGTLVMYMGVLLHVENPTNWLTSLRKKTEGVTRLITHLSQDTYALKLAKLKEGMQ